MLFAAVKLCVALEKKKESSISACGSKFRGSLKVASACSCCGIVDAGYSMAPPQ